VNIKKESVSYKYKKIENASVWVRIGALISAPFLGINLAVIAMTLSLVIQLFHKMILFNTEFGPYLNYFLVATTNILGGEDEEEGGIIHKFVPRWTNKRLQDEAELNIYTTDAYPLELYMLFGFFLLRLTRYLLKTYVFAKWEEKYGTDIYKKKSVSNSMKDDSTLIIYKKGTDESNKLNEKVEDEYVNVSDFKFNCWRKFLIKIYSLTFILEFILICRLVADIVLHTGYNITRIDYVKNIKNGELMFNHIVSAVALIILSYEILRFMKTNHTFMKEVLSNRNKKVRIKKFNKIKSILSNLSDESNKPQSLNEE